MTPSESPSASPTASPCASPSSSPIASPSTHLALVTDSIYSFTVRDRGRDREIVSGQHAVETVAACR
eukprot:2573922-Ditylum_brightwellii.AAC.1